MKWFSYISEIFFPFPFSETFLATIPEAPRLYDQDTYALYDYHSDSGKRLVYYLKKYRSRRLSLMIAGHMHRHLLEQLAEAQQFSYFESPIVIPVPLSKRSRLQRGFNQNDDIARCLAKTLEGSYEPKLVIKHRPTRKQALLRSKSERIRNVKGCFRLAPSKEHLLLGHDVIVIDDLITTGATAREVKKVLVQGGARRVLICAVAH